MIGRTLGHYEVVSKLGEGGMGSVFKAKDTHLDRFVALKVLPHDKMSDPERRRRFTQEAKAASALNHPNIITIYDISTSEGVDFIAMEYVEGRTLEAVITAGPTRVTDTLKYARQMADALTAAHAAGILHRDLKPANVMVKDSGLVKILDFGLAKLTDDSADTMEPDTTRTMSSTRAGQILGTAAYMSPEQAEGKKLDYRSDIFSFGAVLYELAGGKRAFPGDSHASVMAAILRDEPRPLGELRSDLPWELDQLITRCLRKDPSRRIQTMADLKATLEDLPDPVTRSTTTSGRFAPAPPPIPVTTSVLGPPPVPVPPPPVPAAAPAPVMSSDPVFAPVPPPPPIAFTSPPASFTPPAPSPPVAYPPPEWLASQEKARRSKRKRGLLIIAVFILVPYLLSKVIKSVSTPPPPAAARRTTGQVVLLQPGTPLTGNPGNETMPSFSPDGTQIVYMWNGGKGDHLEIYKRPLGDGAPVRLTTGNHRDFAPVWSPDGSTIAFLRHDSTTDEVMLIPAIGGTERKVGEVAKNGRDLYGLAWRKDNKNLIVSDASSTGGEPSLFELSIATGKKRLILNASEKGGDYFPSVSPNGEKVAFVQSPEGIDAQLLTFELDEDTDTAPHHVASLAMRISRPAWTPDNRQLIFAVGEEGAAILWRAQASGQAKPIPLIGVSSGEDPIVFGNHLVYSGNHTEEKAHPLLLVEGFR
jgi:serine/threonine protein kinase